MKYKIYIVVTRSDIQSKIKYKLDLLLKQSTTVLHIHNYKVFNFYSLFLFPDV